MKLTSNFGARAIHVFWVFLFAVFAVSAQAAQRPDSFADLAEKLLPAVVNISTTQEVEVQDPFGGFPMFPPGSPFEDFFRDFFEDRGFPGSPFGAPQEQEGPKRRITSLGSGFIISADGMIVTNNHVVQQADEIKVILHDDTELDAEVIGTDQKTDLALLKVKTDRGLPFVKFGNSDLMRVGDWVLAIGNPFGLGGTVTAGIISARARDINAGPYDDFFQTDASINRGNSGGPLFNMNGEVIGINTAIFSPNGGSIGIGFAIPSKIAQDVFTQIKEFGRTKRGWLGVRIQEVTPDLAESLGMKEPKGALVTSLTDRGPAADAGFEAGDVIIEFDGKGIHTMRDLPRIVASTPVGKKVTVVVIRQGNTRTLSVTLGELEKAEEQMKAEEEKETPEDQDEKGMILGMRLSEITPQLRSRYRLDNDVRGVLVTGVKRNSDASEKAIRVGDVIAEVSYKPVNSPEDIEASIADARKAGKKSVLMRVMSQGVARFVVLRLDEK